MIHLLFVACTTPTPPEVAAAAPEPTIPEAQDPSPTDGPTADAPIAEALSATPSEISSLYTLSLSDDRVALTIDPARPARESRGLPRAGYTAKDSAAGGKVIQLENGPFAKGGWATHTLDSLVSDDGKRKRLEAAGFALDTERPVLLVQGEGDSEPTIFAFSADANRLGMVGICSDVTVLDFGKPTPQGKPPKVVRKPVIYLYPDEPMDVSVDVRLKGDFLVRYPAMGPGGWQVHATPDGLLHTEDGRTHRYLFWEGVGADFEVDPEDAFCIRSDEAVAFLESTCDSFALNDAECGDFVTYWLPSLLKSPYTLVTFPEAAYAEYASLHVDPRPDTVIRLFMAFRGVDHPVEVGNPVLQKRQRRGFTVVEWGGVDLAETPSR